MRLCFWVMIWAAAMLCLPTSSLIAQDTTAPGVTIHVVQRGETLFEIALSYGVTTDELANLNGIGNPDDIQVGERLLVPAKIIPTPVLPETHIVESGETLASIADLYGLTVDDLVARNEIANVDKIYVGQTLNIAAATASPTPQSVSAQPTPALQSIIHTVLRGETLFRIATGYGLTVNDLVEANNITDPTLIYAGEQLIVPGINPPQLGLDLPPVVSNLEVAPLILVEGQTGRFRLNTTVPMNVTGSFLNRALSVASEHNSTVHTALVGIPEFSDAGIYPLALSLTDSSGQQTTLNVNIQIVSGGYGDETITLDSSEAYLLDPTLEASEQTILQNVMTKFTPTRYFDGPMTLPAAASVTSPFGLRRSYNGGPFDHFHTGTDFAGAPGTPILSAAPGYVVLAARLAVRGNATIIDHGWGVFTGYWHQSEQYVKVGDFVTAGQVIGTVGSTGRVTGPHLHWEMWVNGVPVDAMQWVQQSFS